METIPHSHIFYIQRLKVPGITIFSRKKSLKPLPCFHILIVSHRLPKSHIFTQTTIFCYIFSTFFLSFSWTNCIPWTRLFVLLSQSDIRNPLSLLAHNQITASQFIRRGLYPFWYKQVPTHYLLLFAIEAGDLLDLVKNWRFNFDIRDQETKHYTYKSTYLHHRKEPF